MNVWFYEQKKKHFTREIQKELSERHPNQFRIKKLETKRNDCAKRLKEKQNELADKRSRNSRRVIGKNKQKSEKNNG